MAGVEYGPTADRTHPAWAKDFGSRDHLIPGGAKLDPVQFPREGSVLVTVAVGGGDATNEIQTATVTGTPTGGTFTLTFDGQTTDPIAYNASATVVQTALRSLPNIGANGVNVTGSAGGPYTITAAGPLAGTNIAAITASGAGLTGGTSPGVTMATTTPGAAAGTIAIGATALPVSALGGPIPAFAHLRFSNGMYVNVAQDAAISATSLVIEPSPFAIPDGVTAQFVGSGKVSVRDGIFIGRTYAERAAGSMFGPAETTDDEVFLTYHPVHDLLRNNDVTLYRPGSLVAENHLPGFATMSAALLAKLRATYRTTRGAD